MLSRKTVLIVEDVEINRKLLKNILNDEYNVIEAENGKEALKLWRKNKQGIMTILLDLIMPEMNGYEFLEYRKHDLDLMAIPVIVITQSDEPDCGIKVLDLGATDILHKPYDPRIVTIRVRNMLQKYELDEMRVEDYYVNNLEKTSQKLDALINNVMCGISIIELHGQKMKLNFANKQHLEMFGIKEENMSKADVVKNILADDLKEFIKMINSAKASLDTFECVYRYAKADDDVKYFKTKCMKVKNPDGNDITLLCITTDETEYTNTFNELRGVYEKTNAVFESIEGGVGIIELDSGLKLTYANDGLYKMVKYPKNETDILSTIISPDENKRILKELNECEIGDTWAQTIKLMSKNFEEVLVYIKGKIIENPETKNKVFVAIFVDLTEEKKLEEKIKYLAEYDDLTKVFNQTKFVEVTEAMVLKNPDKQHLLVMLDVYRFKNIKTIFGKKSSDELLKIIGAGLKTLIKYGTRGRIENDIFTFCVLEEGFDIENFVNQMNAYILQNYGKSNIELYYAAYVIDDPYLPIDTVVLRTNYALNEIKGNVFKKIIYCDNDIRKRALLRDEIKTEMFDSLSKGEFEVFIQPVYDIKTREIESAEALVRWNHPKKGYIFPISFIAVFEENGFIINLDEYIWNEVALLIRKWIDNNMRVIPISINVSRVDLYNCEFYEKITKVVENNRIPPQYLRLEITESAYIINEGIIGETIRKLKEYGFIVLMDDFGSGYSSLNSLKDIKFDVLKLDMKLISNIENNTRSANILKSIIDMANSLELPIIAEGVETEAQLEFLEKNGCQKVQGFLFSKAVPVSEIEEMLNKR